MKITLFLIGCLWTIPAFAQIDPALLRQAESWKNGETPPPRLLKFPDGKIDEFPLCGMRVLGSEVADYISQIQNSDLLGALLVDHRAQPDTLRATATQLIRLKGTNHVAGLLASQPREAARSELVVLAQLLRSPYAAVQVARITRDAMEPAAAEAALDTMRRDLEAGTTWAAAYEKISDQHPDLKDRAKDPRSIRTLVGYLYEGVVSPNGFDILYYTIAANLPVEHLQEIFRTRRRTSIIKAPDGAYLYYVKAYYDGGALLPAARNN